MNEPAFADRVCRALDEKIDDLPERVTQRLAAARTAAMALAPVAPAHAMGGRTARAGQARARSASRAATSAGGPSLRWLPVPLATVLFAGALLAVWHWSDLR